ncbi:unnamed protein product, partial [marine sediment metagenome]
MKKITIKKTVIFSIIVFSLIIPNYYSTFKDGIKSSEKKINEKGSIVQPSAGDYEFLPNINWTFINSVEIISGTNATINDITDLQFNDNNTYDIKGVWTGSQWEYEIYFAYEVDLTVNQLDYYDIYLFLDVEQPIIQSGLIEFQTNSSYTYVNLINITNQPIRVEDHFLERTT